MPEHKIFEKLTDLIEASGMVETKNRCEIIAAELVTNGVTLPQHGRWIPRNPAKPDGWHYCSTCKRDVTAIKAKYYKFCPECGTIMDLPRITDQANKALLNMVANAHGGADYGKT